MITYQQEFLFELREEARPLLVKHWEEVALNKEKIKLDPDWEAYEKLEDVGCLKIFTCRDKGRLIGYFAVLASPHLHYKSNTFANNDVIYVDPDYRKGWVGIKLIKFAEKCLREDGVDILHINTKIKRDFSRVLERMGYAVVEKIYGKAL